MSDRITKETSRSRQDWFSNYGDADQNGSFRSDRFQSERFQSNSRFYQEQNGDFRREVGHGNGCCCNCCCGSRMNEEVYRGRLDEREARKEAYLEGYQRGLEQGRSENQCCFRNRRTEADDVCNPSTVYYDRDKYETKLYQSMHDLAARRLGFSLDSRGRVYVGTDDNRFFQPHAIGSTSYDWQYRNSGCNDRRSYDRNLTIPEGCYQKGRDEYSKNDKAKRILFMVGNILKGVGGSNGYFDALHPGYDYYGPWANRTGSGHCFENDGLQSFWPQTNNGWDVTHPGERPHTPLHRHGYTSNPDERSQPFYPWRERTQPTHTWNDRTQPDYGPDGLYDDRRQNFPGGFRHDERFSDRSHSGNRQVQEWLSKASGLGLRFRIGR